MQFHFVGLDDLPTPSVESQSSGAYNGDDHRLEITEVLTLAC